MHVLFDKAWKFHALNYRSGNFTEVWFHCFRFREICDRCRPARIRFRLKLSSSNDYGAVNYHNDLQHTSIRVQRLVIRPIFLHRKDKSLMQTVLSFRLRAVDAQWLFTS